MSGLLSKATAAEETTPSKPVEEEAKSETGALAQAIEQSDGPDISTILTSAGWAVIVVGGLLSLQGGSWGLIVVLCVLVIGIGALYAGQNMSEGGVSPVRMGGAAVLAVLLAAGPYGVSMFMPDSGSFGISELELREDTDEISFRVMVRRILLMLSSQLTALKCGPNRKNSQKNLLDLRCRFLKFSLVMLGSATLVVAPQLQRLST